MPDHLIKEINSWYNFSEPVHTIKKFELETMNPNFIVAGDTVKYFLKNYRLDVAGSIERLNEIQLVEEYFYTHGIPVIATIKTSEGGYNFEYEGKIYSIYPFIEAKTINKAEKLSDMNILSLGETLGRIHRAGSKAPRLSGWEYKGWNSEKFFQKYAQIKQILMNKGIMSDFDHISFDLLESKHKFVKSVETNGFILSNDHLVHGDFHERNVFFNNDGTVQSVFDFEKTAIYPRTIELARSLDIICISAEKAQSKDLSTAKKFLSAYDAVYKVTGNEFKVGFIEQIQNRISSLWGLSEYYVNNHEIGKSIILSESSKLDWYVNDLNEIAEELAKEL